MADIIDFSTEADDPILQGVDSVLVLGYGPDEPLAATDQFLHYFFTAIGEPNIGSCDLARIDLQNREVQVIIDGDETMKWLADSREDYDLENRDIVIYSILLHQDKDGNDYDDSGLEFKWTFRLTGANKDE